MSWAQLSNVPSILSRRCLPTVGLSGRRFYGTPLHGMNIYRRELFLPNDEPCLILPLVMHVDKPGFLDGMSLYVTLGTLCMLEQRAKLIYTKIIIQTGAHSSDACQHTATLTKLASAPLISTTSVVNAEALSCPAPNSSGEIMEARLWNLQFPWTCSKGSWRG